jgi:tetratricopeptide (TPR) repeat protein
MLKHIWPILAILAWHPAQSQVQQSLLVGYSFSERININWNFEGRLQAIFNDALNNMDEGRYSHAASQLEECIKRKPDFGIAYYYLGLCKKNLNDLSQSQAIFLEAQKWGVPSPPILIQLGEISLRLQNYNQADKYFRKCLNSDYEHIAHFFLGHLAIIQLQPAVAERRYKQCIAAKPFAPAHLQLAILSAARKRDVSIALDHFSSALALDSAYKEAYVWRALFWLGSSNYDKALIDLSTAIRLDPSNYSLVFLRGLAYSSNREFDLAFRDFKTVVTNADVKEEDFTAMQTFLDRKIDIYTATRYVVRYGYGLEDEAFLNIKKGFCELIAGDHEAAANSIELSLSKQESSVGFYLRGLVYEHQGNEELAMPLYQRALELDADLYDAYKKRAVYRYKMGDWRGSFSDFSQMIRIEPHSLLAHRLRGYIKANLGDYYGCIIDLTEVLKSDSTDFKVWKTRAVCRQNVRDSSGALYDYRKSLLLNPTEVELYPKIYTAYLQLKDTTRALATLFEYETSFPGLAKPRVERAYVYFHQNKLALARDELEAISDTLKGGIDEKLLFHFLFAEVAKKQNDWDVARISYNRYLTLDPNNIEIMNRLFDILLSNGRRKEAAEILKRLKKLGAPNLDEIESRFKDTATKGGPPK